MSRALMVVRSGDWQLIQNIAPAALACRMFKLDNPEQAAMIMLKGHELGLGLAASFEFIHVIDGKPSVSPKGALALIHGSGELAGIRIEDKVDSCTVWMKRKNGVEYTVTYTMDDAKRAQLTEGSPKKSGGKRGYGNWEKYPANMLRWRAVGYCADVVFPDVIGGMLRPEELGAEVDEQGEPEWAVSTPEPVVTTTSYPVEPTGTSPDVTTRDELELPRRQSVQSLPMYPTIDALLKKWDAETILVANEGIIPGTAADCQRVAEKLLEGQNESES